MFGLVRPHHTSHFTPNQLWIQSVHLLQYKPNGVLSDHSNVCLKLLNFGIGLCKACL